ncbi:PVC-type heme-binding CxxCH protein [Luteolibacter algae]|uniref:PVC-type heme-binding CxxCH protein n=1 Tax=Luteolibacter algae TaxID=454151 RepID=A0ABW5D9V9_9BACT
MKTLGAFSLILSSAAYAWQPSQEPPTLPLKSFTLPEGLEVTAWAKSPMLYNPTNMDVDQYGRIWVTEGVNYRKVAERRPDGDRIVILEDTDGDGTADKSSVFWQDPELVSPLGIAVFDNVVMVSQPPNLLKLTDKNRDGKFNEADGDIREVFLTGFNGLNHDHSLHSVTAGPDGKWVFNQGNTGAMFTDKSGGTFKLGGSYVDERISKYFADVRAIAGQKSSDGFAYNSGAAFRLNPDGTGTEVIGHGFRNSYEQITNSFGFVFQNDNDDPPACRVTHMIEHGNAGFFSRDGKRMWRADMRPGQDVPTAEWRQEDPGTMPSGDVYGGGSPTGVAFYENGALGDDFIGTLLSCEPGRNVVFSYQPELSGAGFKLERHDFVTTNPQKDFDGSDFVGGTKKDPATLVNGEDIYQFRPSDIAVGTDGAIYMADWTDHRVGGHATLDEAASGVIYRIAPKGFSPVTPVMDVNTIEGALTALKSPAHNVRWLGFEKLKKAEDGAFTAVLELLKNENPYIAARAIWLLPYFGGKGRAELDALFTKDDENIRLAAFRALRRCDGKIDPLSYAKELATDASAAIRAEAALEMRYRNFDEAKEVLIAVAESYDGKDRSYLESLGLGAGLNSEQLWQALHSKMKPGEPTEWSDPFSRLTWRLLPQAAVSALAERAGSEKLSEEQRNLAVDSLAFINCHAAAEALIALAKQDSPVHEKAVWWLNNRVSGEWAFMDLRRVLQERGILRENAGIQPIAVPEKPASLKFTVDDVLALEGDADRGAELSARCLMCHLVDDKGTDYGPSLKGFGQRQPADVLARSIIDPSFDISHGFEGHIIDVKSVGEVHGLIISDGDVVKIRSTGGITQNIPKRQIRTSKALDRSLMLSADQLGLSAQDVADLVEWLKNY